MQDEATTDSTGQAADAAAAGPDKIEELNGLWERLAAGDFSQGTWIQLWTVIGQPLVVAIVLIVAVLLVSGWARGLTTKTLRKAKVEETLARFFGNAIRWTVMLLGGLAILSTFGVNTTSFAAVIAAMGFAIGMAFSGTLGNFASGIMLLVFRPFKVGDVVKAAGVFGTVDEIGMFSTTFDTFQKIRIIVPNGKIFGDTIENITHHPVRRMDVNIGTAYDADIDECRRVLERVCANVAGSVQDPKPQVFLSEFGASSIDWQLRVWANAPDLWTMRENLIRDAKKALDEAGIGIPFPQRDVHVPEGLTVTVKNA
ncbi:MAG: mechanosensitive ion channel family protein [Phycisphaerales bacterium]